MQLYLKKEKKKSVQYPVFPVAWLAIYFAENKFSVQFPHSPLQTFMHTHAHTPQSKKKIK